GRRGRPHRATSDRGESPARGPARAALSMSASRFASQSVWHRFRHRHLFALPPGEHLRDAERLAEEALNLARTDDGELVLRRQLVHAENGNDVLQIFESLQHPLDTTRHVVVLLAMISRRRTREVDARGVTAG